MNHTEILSRFANGFLFEPISAETVFKIDDEFGNLLDGTLQHVVYFMPDERLIKLFWKPDIDCKLFAEFGELGIKIYSEPVV